MENDYQHTIAGEFELAGIGIHSGAAVTLRARPAPEGSGITFKRTDLPGAPTVPANLDHVTGTELGTSLGTEDTHIATVEHVLAALSACEVDNVVMEANGPEVPILDGSFAPWLDALHTVVRTAFGQRRKRLGNALQSLDLDLTALGVDPGSRAEEIGVSGFVAMSNQLHRRHG